MRQLQWLIILGIAVMFLMVPLATTDLSAITDLSDGLVLYLPFDEGSGKVANDLSGNKHNGVINGATWTKGKFGAALDFNGVDNFVKVPYDDDFIITEAITLGAWVTANVPFPLNWKGIINARSSTYGPYLLQTGASPAAPLGEMGLYLAGAWTWAQTLSPLDKNFHHLVGTYDPDQSYILYFDGKPNNGPNSGPANTTIDKDPGKEGIVIGHNYGYVDRWWDGIIDEVIIYNRVLTADEVAELFQQSLSTSLAVGSAGNLSTTWGKIKE